MIAILKSLTGRIALIAVSLALAGCMQSGVAERALEPNVSKQQTYSYSRDVKPILDQKCITCHACYDAPCQLQLTSSKGLLRGATTTAGYAYTLIRNKAHTNVAFMFSESDRRVRSEDTLTIYPGLLGSYPNFMFRVPLERIDAFTAALHPAQTAEQFSALVYEFGLRRTNPAIWENFQWFVDHMRRTRPLEAGVYDLGRYKMVAEMTSDESG